MIITMDSLNNMNSYQQKFKAKTTYHGNIVLFLDFDGVLHPLACEANRRFENVNRLEKILAKFPNIIVVISSMWGHDTPLHELRKHFPKSIHKNIIGSIQQDRYKRCDNIKEWLGQTSHCRYYPWIAIDDSAFFEDDSPVVWCDPRIGWNDETTKILEEAIKSPHEYKQHWADRPREWL